MSFEYSIYRCEVTDFQPQNQIFEPGALKIGSFYITLRQQNETQAQ